MKKNIQWAALPLLILVAACTSTQVPETIPPKSGTWDSNNLVGNIYLPAEKTIAPTMTPPMRQNLYSGKLMVPSGASLINPEKSILTVHVNKAGFLSFLGHQHIVASRNLDGWVDEAKNQGYFSFEIAKMTMDEPLLLKGKMLADELNPAEKEATKQNMLKMLDAKNFPDVRVAITSFDPKKSMIHAKIMVKDQMIERDLLVKVTRSANNKITTLTGETSLKLLDFSVEPFSALGGLLSVNNEISIEWNLTFK